MAVLDAPLVRTSLDQHSYVYHQTLCVARCNASVGPRLWNTLPSTSIRQCNSLV